MIQPTGLQVEAMVPVYQILHLVRGGEGREGCREGGLVGVQGRWAFTTTTTSYHVWRPYPIPRMVSLPHTTYGVPTPYHV